MSASSLEDVGSHLNIQRDPHFTSICCFGFEEWLPSRLTAPILTSASIMSPQSPARRSAAGGLNSPQRSASRSWRWKLCPDTSLAPCPYDFEVLLRSPAPQRSARCHPIAGCCLPSCDR